MLPNNEINTIATMPPAELKAVSKPSPSGPKSHTSRAILGNKTFGVKPNNSTNITIVTKAKIVGLVLISLQNSESPVNILTLLAGAEGPREWIKPSTNTAKEQAPAMTKYAYPLPHFAIANPTPRAATVPPDLIDKPR